MTIFEKFVMDLPGKSLTAVMKTMQVPEDILVLLVPKMSRYNWNELCSSQMVSENFIRENSDKLGKNAWINLLLIDKQTADEKNWVPVTELITEDFVKEFDHMIPVEVFERISIPLSQEYIGSYLMNLPRSVTKKRILNNVLFKCYDLTEEFVETHWDTLNEENINGIMSINYSPQFIIEHWSDLVKNVNLLGRQCAAGNYIDQDIYQTDEILLLRKLQ